MMISKRPFGIFILFLSCLAIISSCSADADADADADAGEDQLVDDASADSVEDDSEEEPRQWWRFIFNDTGIDWCGTEVENNLDCPLPEFPGQDGVDGRDAQALAGTLEKEGRGAAGFDFTKIGADGSPLSVQDQLFQEGGSEAEGTSWSCVQDNHTGLLWEIKTNEGLQNKAHTYSWYSLDEETNGGDEGSEARGECEDIDCDTSSYEAAIREQGLCGVSDWRMPSRLELGTIIHRGERGPAVEREFFPDIPEAVMGLFFWTATSESERARRAFGIYFSSGQTTTNLKRDLHSIRLVHGPTPPTLEEEAGDHCLNTAIAASTPTSDFTLDDDRALHHRTGLEWQRCAVGQLFAEGSCTGDASELTWQEALQEADGSEWRLPKINELSTIVEECRHASTINPEIFPDSPSFYFLSSSPVAMEDPPMAMVWTVNFNSGSEVANSRATTGWVRLVRDVE